MKNNWGHVHWFLTGRCNLECTHCFRPKIGGKEDSGKIRELAEILRECAEKVSFTGGEPTLVRGFQDVLSSFKHKGVYISLHTNGISIDGKVSDLASLVDDIAVPLDSLDRETQRFLKGRDYLPISLRVINQVRAAGIDLGIHTVFNDTNAGHIPRIYRFLRKTGFSYWNVYEYNPDLVADRFASCSRFQQVRDLEGSCSYEKGGTDCLFARFLETEDRILRAGNKKVQFVSLRDVRPYTFLDSNGDVYFSVFFSGKRVKLGNLLEQGFDQVNVARAEAISKGLLFDEEGFVEIQNNLPFFACLYEGNYWDEDVDGVDGRSWGKITRFHDLYVKRFYGEEEMKRAISVA
ncbi:MAG: radical SAM protein [Nanoarchaeota archaeon]|nr:radical SAM protein [Nanoarchaeota archaeon]MBU4085963.1 radical SAM protein [Nanoarchaeota archaeon]